MPTVCCDSLRVYRFGGIEGALDEPFNESRFSDRGGPEENNFVFEVT
jgi:hypothetical protein